MCESSRRGHAGVTRVLTVTAIAVVLPLWACLSTERVRGPMECRFEQTAAWVAGRPSPFDSAMAHDDGRLVAKLCYSRPSARGREIFGALVPWDTLWRTGANEATAIHLVAPAEIAGIPVDSGEYTLYTVPRPDDWYVVVNASTGQWGLTRDEVGAQGNQFYNAYTEEVRALEVDRASIDVEEIEMVDTLTAHFEPDGEGAWRLLFDWERTRVVIPVRFTSGGG